MKELYGPLEILWGNSLHWIPSCLMPLMRKMGRVLVEMEIFCGLPETLEIEWRGRKITQPLDYLALPF
jgi:hypothetical protein